MPIKELTHGVQPRFERLGKIRLGVRVPVIDPKTGRPKTRKLPDGAVEQITRPQATGYFVVPPEVAGAIGEEKPKRLRIFFPFDDIDRCFDAWHKLYGFGGLKCQGDGEVVVYAVRDDGTVLSRDGVALVDFRENEHTFKRGDIVPCSGFGQILYPKCAGCRPVAHLRVMIDKIPRLGYWQITTGSKNSILNVHGALTWVKEWFGHLRGVAFVLELREEEISCPIEDGKGGRKRISQKKYILHLEPEPEWVEAFVKKAVAESLPQIECPSLPGPAALYDSTLAEDDEDMLPSEEYDGEDEVVDAVATLEGKANGGKPREDFWTYVYTEYVSALAIGKEEARARAEKALEEAGGDKAKALTTLRIEVFLGEYALSDRDVRKALGRDIASWLEANPGKSLDDAFRETLAVLGRES